MKKNTRQHLGSVFLVLLLITCSIANSQQLSYHGRIIDSVTNLGLSGVVEFRFQVRTPSTSPANCLMYEEIVSRNVVNGVYVIGLNNGSGIVSPLNGYTVQQVFSNKNTFGAFNLTGNCTAGGPTYTPLATDTRRVSISFRALPTDPWEPLPTQTVAYVPSAIESLNVGGFSVDALMRVVDASGNPFGVSPLSNAQYTELINTLTNNSSFYLKTGDPAVGFTGSLTGDVTGTQGATSVDRIRGVNVNLAGLASGQTLQYNGTSFVPVLDGGGTVTNVSSSNAYLTVATGTTTPVITLNVGTVAGSVAAGNDVRITNALQSGSSAGGDLAGTLPNPTVATVGGSTAAQINTSVTDTIAATNLNTASTLVKRDASGNIAVGSVSATNASVNNLRIYNAGNANSVLIKMAAAVSGDYTLTLPTTLPVAGTFLGTNASGDLSWLSPSAFSITNVTATLPMSSSGGTSPNISIAQSSTTTDGYLSSTDFVTFNNKLSTALPTGQVWVGAAGVAAPQYLNSTNVRSSMLPALNAWFNVAAACPIGQQLNYSMITDQVSCADYSLSGNQVVTALSPVMTGDVTMNASGDTTISNNAITDAKILSGDISFSKLKFSTLPNTFAAHGITDITLSNVGGVDTIQGGTLAARPAAVPANVNRVYVASDTGEVYYSNGAAWLKVGSAVGLGGTVTSVTAAATALNPIVIGGTAVAPTIDLPRSTAAVDGYLASSDFSNFNNKLGLSTSFSGDVTGTYNATVLAPSGATPGQYARVTVDAKGRVTGGVSSLDISTAVSGVLPVANGGSGAASFTAGDLLIGNNTSAFNTLAAGANGNILYVSGGAWTSGTPASNNILTTATALSGDVSGTSSTITLNNTGVVASADYTKVTVDAKGRVTAASRLVSADISTLYGYTPANSGASVASVNSLIGPLTLTNDTTGTDFNITSAGTTITLNLPSSSAANRGLLTSSDFTTFNNKLGTASTFSGDVSGTSSTISVDRIKGQNLTLGALTSGNYLRSNGTAWVNSNLVSADITASLGFTPISESLTSANIFVGNGSNIATGVALSGDATINNTGVLTFNNTGVVASADYTKVTVDAKGRVTAASRLSSADLTAIFAGSLVTAIGANPPISITGTAGNPVVNIDQADSTTSGFLTSTDWDTFNNKLEKTLNSGTIFVGDGSNEATGVPLTGDATISNTGVLTFNNTGVVASADYTKLTVDAKGRVTAASRLVSADISTLYGYTPANGAASVSSVNGLIGALTLDSSTTGTDFNISSLGTTITLNLPSSSATNRGLLTSSDFTTFNNKLTSTLSSANIFVGNGSNIATAVALSGDATINNTGAITLTNSAVTRTNLGLGSSATRNVAASGDASPTEVVKGDDTRLTDARTPTGAITSGDLTGSYPSPILTNTGVVASADYTKVTVDAKGRVTAASRLTSADLTAIFAGSLVTNIDSNPPILTTVTAGNAVISINQADSENDGFLLSTDWDTFNNKLEKTLNSGAIFVGNGSNVATAVALSGDATINNTGVLSFNNTGVVASADYTKVTVDAKGRVTAASRLVSADISTLYGYTPANGAASVSSVNGLIGALTLDSSTTGTDFNISSLGTTITLNLPSSSATNRGLLTSSDFTTFNNKLTSTLSSANIFVGNGSNVATARALSGDATLNSSGDLTLANTAVIAGSNYTKFNVDSKGRVISASTINSTDISSFGFVQNGNSFGAAASLGTNDNNSLGFKTNNLTRMSISASGDVGIGTTTPGASLDVSGAFAMRGMASIPAQAPVGQGRIYFDTAESKYKVSQSNGAYVDLVGGGGSLSSLTAATAINSLDNSNFAQTWNWSTATTQTPLTMTANTLTTGSILSLTSSSAVNTSTTGLLYVANSTATTTGTVARIQSNTTAGSGLTVNANGFVGIGKTTPTSTETLEVRGATSASALVRIAAIDSIRGLLLSGGNIPSINAIDTAIWLSLNNNASNPVVVGNTGATNPTSHFSVIGVGTATDYFHLSSITSGLGDVFTVKGTGNVGIGTNAPLTTLDINGAETMRGMASIPAQAPVGQGRIYFNTAESKYKVSQSGETYVDLVGGGGSLSSLTAATGANSINNATFAQTWAWSSATTQNPMTMTANALTTGNLMTMTANGLTTGSILRLTSSSGTLNSTDGLLVVRNIGTSTTGTVARIQANSSDATSGLTVLANGNVGIGTTTPARQLQIHSPGADNYIHITSNTTGATLTDGVLIGTGSAGGDAAFYNRENTNMNFYTNNIERVRIDNTGKVGIGTNGPGAQLHTNTSASGTIGQIIRGAAGQTANLLEFQDNAGGTLSRVDSSGKFWGDGSNLTGVLATPSGIAGSIQFSGGAAVSSDSSNFFWNNSTKRLGIGTATPSTQLHIANSAGSFNPVHIQIAGNGGIVIERTGGSPGSINLSVNANGKAVLSASQDISFSPFGASDALNVKATTGNVGIGTTAPTTGARLDIVGTDAASSSIIIPRASTPQRPVTGVNGMLRYNTTNNKFEAFENGAWLNMISAAGGGALSSLTAATATNAIDNSTFAQTWTWGAATNALTMNSGSLTTGTLLRILSTNVGLNSTNGLLYVANNTATTSGTVARIQSNSTAGSGLTVLANGNVGIGVSSPLVPLDVTGPMTAAGTSLLLRNGDGSSGGGNYTQIRLGYENSDHYQHYIRTRHNSSAANNAIDFYVSDGTTAGVFPTNAVHNLSLVSGNVGIGTTTPGASLDVSGSFAMRGMASAPAFAPAGQGRIYFNTTESKYKVSQSGGTYVDLVGGGGSLSSLTGATGANSINNATFAQTWAWSSATTQNPMTMTANALTTGNLMTMTANALTTGSILSLTSSSAVNNSPNGLLYVANSTATTTGTVARIESNSTAGSGLTVRADGNVGIGTTAPANRLEVQGTSLTSGSITGTQPGIAAVVGDNYSSNDVVALDFRANNQGNDAMARIGLIMTSSGSLLQFGTTNDYSAGINNTAMAINSTGNVGIGTSNPTEMLAVAGTGAIGGDSSLTAYSTAIGDSSFLQFKKSNSNTLGTLTSTVDKTALGAFGFYGVGSGGSWAFGGAVRGYQDGAAGTTATPTRFEISTSPGGSTAPISRIAIKPGGNVGIGTTTPTAKLDVTGQFRSTNSAGATQTNASADINWDNGNVQTMSVDCASTAFTNMLDSATYVLAVSETGTSTCVFAQAGLTFYYSPANAARYSGQRTVYTFQRIGTYVYVSWVRGFQ